MPLFEILEGDTLIPFRQLRGGAELYEREIEALLWSNPEDFTGEALFCVARQPKIPGGGRPDVVALDRGGHVIVIEVKRDVERNQLAQTLEYAGWARQTGLDELSGLYEGGGDAFFKEWQEFTDSPSLVRVARPPRLLLIAREFHDRTESALQFLIESDLPIQLIRVAIYQDAQSRKFVDVEGEHEPEQLKRAEAETITKFRYHGRAVRIPDLLEAGLLAPGQRLVWDRPRRGTTHYASVLENGGLQLEDGRVFSSPSTAAVRAAGSGAYDGWHAWRLDGPERVLLDALRKQLVEIGRSL